MIRPIRISAAALAAASLLAGGILLAAEQITGRYVGNAEAASLAHVRVLAREAWEGEQAWTMVLSEKDPGDAEDPGFDAQFGRLGHALVVHITESGSIFGTQVCHQALKRAGFSTTGSLKVEGFAIESGTLRVRLFTDGVDEFFDDRWEADLRISAPLPGKSRPRTP